MTFYEWMNDKYPDPDTACGELAAYIRDIDALRAAVAYQCPFGVADNEIFVVFFLKLI